MGEIAGQEIDVTTQMVSPGQFKSITDDGGRLCAVGGCRLQHTMSESVGRGVHAFLLGALTGKSPSILPDAGTSTGAGRINRQFGVVNGRVESLSILDTR